MIYIFSGWKLSVIKRIAKIGTWVLLICSLLLGITAGINWLSHQDWGSGVTITCTDCHGVTTKVYPNGTVVISIS